MKTKELDLNPVKELLDKEVDPEYLANLLTEMLIAHLRVSLFVLNKDMDNHVYIHTNNEEHIYFLQKLIDALKQTEEINKQSKN